jgi:hypothetical protein
MGHSRSTAAPDYDADFFAWTQHQARLLRSFRKWAADLPPEIDFAQVAEEIEDLGKAELNAVKSFVRQILVHLIEAASDPRSQALAHWRSEATSFHADLLDRYEASMRQRIDIDALWQRARGVADAVLGEHGSTIAAGIPEECPFSVADIVAPHFRFDDALEKIAARPPTER